MSEKTNQENKRTPKEIKKLFETVSNPRFSDIHLKLEKSYMLDQNDMFTIQTLYFSDFIKSAKENSKVSIRLSKAMAWLTGALVFVALVNILLQILN